MRENNKNLLQKQRIFYSSEMIHMLVLSRQLKEAMSDNGPMIYRLIVNFVPVNRASFTLTSQIQPRPALMWLRQMVKEVLSVLVLSVSEIRDSLSHGGGPSFLTDHCLDKDESAVQCLCSATTGWCLKIKVCRAALDLFSLLCNILTTSERLYRQLFNKRTVALRDVSAGVQSPVLQCI